MYQPFAIQCQKHKTQKNRVNHPCSFIAVIICLVNFIVVFFCISNSSLCMPIFNESNCTCHPDEFIEFFQVCKILSYQKFEFVIMNILWLLKAERLKVQVTVANMFAWNCYRYSSFSIQLTQTNVQIFTDLEFFKKFQWISLKRFNSTYHMFTSKKRLIFNLPHFASSNASVQMRHLLPQTAVRLFLVCFLSDVHKLEWWWRAIWMSC